VAGVTRSRCATAVLLSDPEHSCCREATKSRLLSRLFWSVSWSRALNVGHRALPIVCAPKERKQASHSYEEYDIKISVQLSDKKIKKYI
jgi:hypothetical protein